MLKDSVKVKGDGESVTIFNLVRSYILLHHKDQDCFYYTTDLMGSLDFLNYSKLIIVDKNEDFHKKFEEVTEDLDMSHEIVIKYKNKRFIS